MANSVDPDQTASIGIAKKIIYFSEHGHVAYQISVHGEKAWRFAMVLHRICSSVKLF